MSAGIRAIADITVVTTVVWSEHRETEEGNPAALFFRSASTIHCFGRLPAGIEDQSDTLQLCGHCADCDWSCPKSVG